MSAYVVVEASVRDPKARDQYAPRAIELLKEFGGEVVVFGPWEPLLGEPGRDNGMIIRFPDKDAAHAWYNSPAYKTLVDIREAGLDCRFRLLG